MFPIVCFCQRKFNLVAKKGKVPDYGVIVIKVFILAMIYTGTTAQEKKEKLVFMIGIMKVIDFENRSITIAKKNRDGSIKKGY